MITPETVTIQDYMQCVQDFKDLRTQYQGLQITYEVLFNDLEMYLRAARAAPRKLRAQYLASVIFIATRIFHKMDVPLNRVFAQSIDSHNLMWDPESPHAPKNQNDFTCC